MLSPKSKLSIYLLTTLLLIVGVLGYYFKATPHYANIEFTNPEQVEIHLLFQANLNKEICQGNLGITSVDLYAFCPNCLIKKQQCLSTLNTQQQTLLLTGTPVAFPTLRLHSGVASFQSTDAQLALNACLTKQGHSTNFGHPLQCSPSHTLRPIASTINFNFGITLFEISLVLATAIIASWFICYLILRYETLHAHLSHDHIQSGVQKFHSTPTPRIGGVAILAGLLAATALEITFHTLSPPISDGFSFFIIASLPVFFGGIIEDVTKNVGVTQRLLFSMLSAALAIWLIGALINRTDIPVVDSALLWLPFAFALTTLAISGACNAMNIIDGYNGLSSGYAVIALAAMSIIAYLVNDHTVMVVSIAMLGSLLGFMVWNWPHGKIFMGDGGAYLLGFILAELAVLLIYRNPSVSPWAPFSLLAYPVFETLFSMFRRKFIHKAKTGQPDAMHLHQLIFIKILRGYYITDPQAITKKNSLVAPFIWIAASINAIIVLCFWQRTAILLPLSIVGCVLYIIVYYKLLSWSDERNNIDNVTHDPRNHP